MNQHITILGYLFLAQGALMILAAVLVSVVLGGSAALSGDATAAGVLAGVSGIVWLVLLVLAVPNLLAGWGLLKRAEWGRVLALVMGALSLLNFPLGTALGAYAIWALMQPEARAEFA